MSNTARLCYLTWILAILPVLAHAHIDASTGQDYQGFDRNDGRGSCCNWLDCRPALAPFMEPDGEKIADRARNKYAFDRSKVVKRPSDDGNWHICTNGGRLRCIIAPPEAWRRPDPASDRFAWRREFILTLKLHIVR
ncbi:hypothetical protein JJB09_13860 [Rhizobium sp. KVB221]|uniref:Uncharacterized protein n=1 Tax=Rhizobium setariae TaxID=2801340 RepID=A0A937CMV0_9HYPH|nr:hypothetical protein [Rhizobium setariae]MBL0373116.1 hypothetical protein [Rhizobium setariae]